jgi:uncharacterized protein (TIGR02646 family)
MIYLKRTPAPKLFASPELAKAREAARYFFAESKRSRSQQRMDWGRTIRLLRGATKDLLLFSNGKCAYCESSITVSGAFNLEHFRPKAQAIGREGDVSPGHYWWLAFEWSNVLPVCQACNVAKATRFPVAGVRAAAETVGKALAAERPLLLDPCADDPNPHLIFDEEGRVSPGSERGEATIEVLALNRQVLVDARWGEILRLRDAFALVYGTSAHTPPADKRAAAVKVFVNVARRALDLRQPYLGAKRQLLALWLTELPNARLTTHVLKELGTLLPITRQTSASRHSRGDIASAQSRLQHQQAAKELHSVEGGSRKAKAAYFGGVRRIERIVIKNFKGIRHLELTVPPPVTEHESWLMLVGENATGKSSILQAVALALLGQSHIAKLALDARTFVTHGQSSGSVEVHLTNVSRPVVLNFSRDDRRFVVTPPIELVLLLGYGATRLLPRSATTKSTPTRYVRVKNLFNPYARLQNAERWLTHRRQVNNTLFNQIAVALKQLLLIENSARVVRERARVKVDIGGDICALRELSDGYQSIVALAVDIMMGLVVRWSSMDVAEGLVLIDELETHLHPRWKMEIVTRLRRVFPKLTFIATTHDPLCLRGLEPGEVVVLRREGELTQPHVIKESLAHLRADQLLTSELFGLIGTRDSEVNNAIMRHAKLSSTSKRSADEEAELRTLSGKLAGKLPTAETSVARAVEETWQHVVEEQVLPEMRRQMADASHMANLPVEAKQALQSLFGSKVTAKEEA